jgi:AcrR family transcriptional regulator
MAWDTEGTKRKILEAAMREFSSCGPDGTTIERIAKLAGVNKERIYNYFGDKSALFARVLSDQLATADELPAATATPDQVAEYAGKLYDYHRRHPNLARLLQWEALTFAGEVPEEQQRRDYYSHRTEAIAAGQSSDQIPTEMAPEVLHFMLLSLVGYWFNLPQVARMITGATIDDDLEDARRRAAVVEAARRLVS